MATDTPTLPPTGDTTCPRCGQAFHCGARDAQPCWCCTPALAPALLATLHERYTGCLCARCLSELSAAEFTATSGTAPGP
ncbi:MAG TPA: cysteine-rich CWC family protein [Albitalea sp.]